MNIESLIKDENVQRSQEVSRYEDIVTGPDNTHSSRPIPRSPELVQRIMEQEASDREARANIQGAEPEGKLETPASLYHQLHGETMLRSVMGLSNDNAHTEEINNYILEKMRIGKMQDTKANFEKVLGRLLAKNNLSMNQQKPYLISKLHLYLHGNLDEEDTLINSIIKGSRRSGIRR